MITLDDIHLLGLSMFMGAMVVYIGIIINEIITEEG